MFWMMNGMGPRGPMNGHRGLNRGFGPRYGRPMMGCHQGSGLWVLALLPALMFGGWMILAVIGAVIGAVIMVISSVFGGLAYAAESVFSGISSAGGLMIGGVIGFVLYRWLRKRNAEKARATEEEANENGESVPEYGTMNSLNNRNG